MGKLLYDLTSCQSSGSTMNHGGKEYAEAVLLEMIRRGVKLSGVYNSKESINPAFLDYCKEQGDLYDICSNPLQEIISSGKYEVFYSPLPYSYHKIDWGNVKFIGNIHGLRLFDAFTDRYEIKYAVTLKAKLISLIKRIPLIKRIIVKKYKKNISKILYNPSFECLTGSNHSKYLIMSLFPGIKEDKIHVYYDPLVLENTDMVKEGKEKYYLLVSGNRWVKNVYRGVLALDDLISQGLISSKVVVTGYVDSLKYTRALKNKDHFVFKGYVSSEELSSLYQNAFCLLFLSLSEGFGYPPLEAISRRVPVICSPLTAIYEVYQNGVLYCDPRSIDDIKVKVLEMENPDIRQQYIEQGVARSKEIIHLQDKDLTNLVNFIVSF